MWYTLYCIYMPKVHMLRLVNDSMGDCHTWQSAETITGVHKYNFNNGRTTSARSSIGRQIFTLDHLARLHHDNNIT